MRIQLIILIFTLTIISCEAKKIDNKETDINDTQLDVFQVTINTLEIDLDGYLRKVVLFRNNFYGMFETGRENTSQRFKKMIVFSKKGEFIEDVFVPEEIQDMPHYDLIVDKDSLYVKESQFEKINLVLGDYVADFKTTKTKDFKIYQDDVYNVYSTCNGEWGGTIYFQNRQTKESYESMSTCPTVINKIDNDYYVTNFMGHMMGFASIIKITDPTKLEKSNLNFDKWKGSDSNQGIETLLDTMDFYIPTSFVANKELLHLYSDKQGTYIGKIENGRIKPIHKFDFKFSAHFNQQLDNGQQILTCHFPANEKNGILIIDGNNFNFYLLK